MNVYDTHNYTIHVVVVNQLITSYNWGAPSFIVINTY